MKYILFKTDNILHIISYIVILLVHIIHYRKKRKSAPERIRNKVSFSDAPDFISILDILYPLYSLAGTLYHIEHMFVNTY
jgi:hypothetical protein